MSVVRAVTPMFPPTLVGLSHYAVGKIGNAGTMGRELAIRSETGQGQNVQLPETDLGIIDCSKCKKEPGTGVPGYFKDGNGNTINVVGFYEVVLSALRIIAMVV